MLALQQDSIKANAYKIIFGRSAAEKLTADSLFTRGFVRALKNENSFYFSFDSLKTISKLYPADSSFRIFTWQLPINEQVVRHHGAIQMKTSDGSLQLFPLVDRTELMLNPDDTVADNRAWVGAVYYKIIQKNLNGRNLYTLIGFSENGIRTDKKIVDVLHFENGNPFFGGNFFDVTGDSSYASTPSRYIMEYQKEASPKLTFDTEMDMIVVEHLVSTSNEPTKKYTLVPDGDYQGYKWDKGKWHYVSKLFTEVTPLGQEPVPQPIRDASGNIDYEKLKKVEQ